MGINPIVDNAASQNSAVVGSNSAAIWQELNRTENNHNTDRVHSESDVSKLVQDQTNPNKAGMSILSSLASKLATLGVSLKGERFKGKAKDALENEYDRLMGGKESFSDSVDIQNAVRRMQQRKNGQGKGQQEGNAAFDKEAQGLMREYAALYAQYSVNGSQELKKRLKSLENALLKKGLKNKDILSLRKSVKNSMAQEIRDQVRDAFLNKVLSKEKSVEMLLSDKSLNDVLDFALTRGTHDQAALQGLADEVRGEVMKDLQAFTREKLEQKLTQKLISQDAAKEGKMKNDLKELIKLSGKVGLDLDKFVKDWQTRKIDLGLFALDIPMGQNGANTDSGKKDPSQYDYTKEDEKDIQINRLRAIYMRQALTGDWRSLLDAQFKLRRAKNGLLSMGVTSKDLAGILAKTKKEGIAAARYRLLDQLKKSFEERATLYAMAGPALKLIEKTIRGLLKNLGRLNWKLSESEVNSIRDSANMKVYDAARQELLTLKDMVKGTKNPALEKRMSLVIKLMKRLREETKELENGGEVPEEEYMVGGAV